MKRFSSLDINVIVRDLREKLTGLRIANIYDVERKTYLFKLQKPGNLTLSFEFVKKMKRYTNFRRFQITENFF